MPPKTTRPLGQMRAGLRKSSLNNHRQAPTQDHPSRTDLGADLELAGHRRLSFLDEILHSTSDTTDANKRKGMKTFNIGNAQSSSQNSLIRHSVNGNNSPSLDNASEVDVSNGLPPILHTELTEAPNNSQNVRSSTSDLKKSSDTSLRSKSNGRPPVKKENRVDNDSIASKLGIDTTAVHRELAKREKELQNRVGQLEGEIIEIRFSIVDRDSQIHKLKESVQEVTIQLDKYRPLYEAEVTAHSDTKTELSHLHGELTKRSIELAQMKGEHSSQLRELIRSYEMKLVDLAGDKDKLIADLEEKIERMKKQMASAFDGNAWERQHQIEELTKELKKVQEENDSHKFQMKKRVTGVCKECDRYAELIREVSIKLAEKEAIVLQMSTKCGEFEKLLKNRRK